MRGDELQNHPGGRMTKGEVQTVTIGEPAHLARVLPALTTRNALAFGCCQYDRARIVSQSMLLDKVVPAADMPTIPRTAKEFGFVDGMPGVMMNDWDSPKDGTPPFTRQQALDLTTKVCPAFAHAPLVLSDSASTHIVNSETGEVLKGAGGLRILSLIHISEPTRPY